MLSKRVLAAAMMVMMTGAIFAGCGNDEKGDTKSDVKVGLSTDEGGVNDKSFNQSAHEGIKKAEKEFGFEYKYVEPKSNEDYAENLETLIDDGAQLVYGVGYKMENAIKDVAANYPDTKFLMVDAKIEAPNVQSVTFKEHEGSFLMGVIAGKMANDGKVGFIGGIDDVLINRFEVGFAAGVMAVNPEAGKLLADRTTVKYANSFSDSTLGYELAKALYDEGCTVVYHAAGGTGEGMFKATKELRDNGKDVWAIGVDMDQAVTTDYGDVILSSMMKEVGTATYNAAKEMAEGKFEGGKAIELGLAENGVGIAPTTDKNTPKDVIELAEKYKKAIVDGKFQVPSTIDELKSFVVPEI